MSRRFPILNGSIKLTPKQAAFLLSRSKVSAAIAGIRGGKTHAGALKTILYALENPCEEDEVHCVCSPTFKMSRVPVQKIFKLLYDESIFPVCPLIKYQKSTRTFTLACNGGVSYIQVHSLHDPDGVRGLKMLSAWIDEAAYVTHDAWDIIQGRLGDVDGPAWLTTTPDGRNWVFDEVYERALQESREGVPIDEREFRIFHWASTENTFINSKNFERLRRNYDSLTYRQEVEGRFVRRAGIVYYCFSRKRNVTGRYAVNPSLPLWVGQDFNVDPMASVLGQPWNVAPGITGLTIVGERKARNSDTYALVKWMSGYCREHNIPRERVTFFPDASGKARSTSGKSDFRIIKEAGFRVEAPLANPRVKDRVNAVNGVLKPLDGPPTRMRINSDCTDVINTLEKQPWDTDKDPPEPDKKGGLDHIGDALGYMVWKKFPIKAKVEVGYQNSQRRAA